ncbi:type VII secretion-associated protein [Nocardia sp. NPDC050378]|uniref:type VII secretion-associated protein n=1 Tax=Nocardia sp. NPDC050378 TaxID=3155400 RepID=UPI0033C9681B
MVASIVSVIDVVVSGARLWARTAAQHTDVIPSVLSVEGGITIGASVGPDQPSVGVLTMADSAWIGFSPTPVSTADAVNAVVDELFSELRPFAPDSTIAAAHPGSWSRARCELFGNALARYSSRVVLEPLATRIASLRQALASSELIVVVEVEPLHLTVSAVARAHGQVRLTACEHDPALGVEELSEDNFERLASMIQVVVEGHRPSAVIVVGQHGAELDEQLRDFVAGIWPVQPPLVQSSTYTALHRPQPRTGDAYGSQGRPNRQDWVGTLRERAAASAPNPRAGIAKAVAAMGLVLVLVSLGAVAILTARGAEGDAATAARAEPTTSAMPNAGPTTTSPSMSSSRPAAPLSNHVLGRVTFAIPSEWQLAAVSTPERATLNPKTAAAARITVTYNTVADLAGYDEVLRDITSRIGRAEPGRFTTPERDVVFAGRRGIGYQELPGDGSVVRWYVLLDHGVQANIGCQHGTEGWGAISSVCEQVVRTVMISP